VDISWACKAIKSLKERCRTLKELAHAMRYYLLDYVDIDLKAKAKYINSDSILILKEVTEKLASLDEFTQPNIERFSWTW